MLVDKKVDWLVFLATKNQVTDPPFAPDDAVRISRALPRTSRLDEPTATAMSVVLDDAVSGPMYRDAWRTLLADPGGKVVETPRACTGRVADPSFAIRSIPDKLATLKPMSDSTRRMNL